MNVCNFRCSKDCAEWCCGGATMITIDEIKKCYDVFPVAIGFRKYFPMNPEHRDFLDIIGTRSGSQYIVGDFIAGNWRRKRCMALNSGNLCKLHKQGRKPLQCRIVPFCAIYPEDKQDVIFIEQKQGKFKKCKGYKTTEEKDCTVWENGRFKDLTYRNAFYDYQKGLQRQKWLMQGVLEELKGQPSYQEFLKGEGIIETHIPPSLLFDVLEAAGFSFNEYHLFINVQGRLCYKELASQKTENPVLADYLKALNEIAESYAAFIKKEKQAAN
jgi:hypothetical protein